MALEFNISFKNIKQGFENVINNTGLMGRWQILGNEPKIVCDTGHNVNGIELIIQQIAMQKFDKLHLVLGMVKDKDINKILALLPVNANYYWCKAQLPRALNEIELQTQAMQYNLNGNAFETVALAFESAKLNASKNDFIFVGGSTFVVAEVL
jgi:dihydrofolate synthase/folylpolyglutamate synthase